MLKMHLSLSNLVKNQRVPRESPADIRSLTSSLSENVIRCFGEMLRNSYGLYTYLKKQI